MRPKLLFRARLIHLFAPQGSSFVSPTRVKVPRGIGIATMWLAAFTPFFTSQERRQVGGQHRLFFSQVQDA